MKFRVSLFLVLVFTFQLVQSQVIEPSTEKSQQEMYDIYSLKYKKLKRTGFILFGAGAGAFLTGIIIVANSDGELANGALVMAAGLSSTLASIPVFIVANSKKRKAEAILETGKIGVGVDSFDNRSYVSAGLRINF